MNKFFLLLLLFGFSAVTCSAQLSGLKNYKWPDKPEQTPVYEKYKNEDAYIIKERKSYSFTVDIKGVYLYTSIKRKIKLLTQKGIDNYAQVVLPKSAGRKLSLVDARTIKKDGTSVDLDVKEIKQVTHSDDDALFDNKKYLLFAIPGAEVGDEIEIIAGYGGYGVSVGQDIYLHSYLPAASSEVILNQSKSIELDIRFYNDMEYPKKQENNTDVTYTWVTKDLPSLENQPGSIPTLELPYISYVVKKVRFGDNFLPQEGVGNAWTSALDWFGNNYLIAGLGPNYRNRGLDGVFEDLWKQKGDSSILSRVKSAHQYINDNLVIVDLPESESNMALNTYITNKKIDVSNLYRIYHYILHKAGAQYSMCMAREFFDGPIDFSYIAVQQINELLFSFKDESGKLHFLMPKSSIQKFEIDEIPGVLQGTKYISIRLDGNKEVSNPSFPYNSATENVRSRQMQVLLSLDSGFANVIALETMQGVYSANARNFYLGSAKKDNLKKTFIDVMKDRNEKAIVDSVSIVSFEDVFPFPFRMNYKYQIPDAVSKVDEKLYAISMEDWFYHSIQKLDSTNRIMNYYFPNLGRDVFKYFITFNQDVQMVNADKLRKVVSLPSSNYSLELTQINPRTILVESAFNIKKIQVPLADIGKFADLYLQLEEADNEALVVKTL